MGRVDKICLFVTVQPPYFTGLGGHKIITVKWRGTLYLTVSRFARLRREKNALNLSRSHVTRV